MIKKGFTLVELLVVISIIGILATIIITGLNSAKNKAKIAAGQIFEKSIYNNYGESLLANYTFDEFNIDDTPVIINSEDGFGANATTFNSPVIVEGVMGNALQFNGTTQYLKTDTITNAKAISLWIKIDSTQTIGWNYVLDAREGLTSGYFADTAIGSAWGRMYVNGVEKPRSWSNIPKDIWTHLYIVSNTSFTDDINFMSRYSNNETKLGVIDNIKIYSEALE